MRARFNGMKYRPACRGDPRLSDTYSIPFGVDGCPTARDETCIAVRRQPRGKRQPFGWWPAWMPKRCVQCSLPCVAMVDIVSARAFPARKGWELTVETMSAKEAKENAESVVENT